MPQLFNCPSCNAGLELEKDSAPAIRCSYCGSTVVVPEHMREKQREPEKDPVFTTLKVEIDHPSAGKTVSGWIVLGVLIVFFTLLGGVIWFFDYQENTKVQLTATANKAMLATQIAGVEIEATSAIGAALIEAPTPTPAPGFASVDLQFGEKGTGRGQFENARWITLDNTGNVYVLDGANGRIQIFSENGEYQSQWQLSDHLPPKRISADRDKHLYVLNSLELARYDALSGTKSEVWALEPLEPFENFFSMTSSFMGDLVLGYWDGSTDYIIFVDKNGATTGIWESPLNQHFSLDSVAKALAIDIQGNVFAFENEAILMFSKDGRFLNRIGGMGRGPGEWSAPQNIAVDNRGYLYIGEWVGIHVYDDKGRFLETIPTNGNVMDLAISDNNDLWVILDSYRVVKYKFNR